MKREGETGAALINVLIIVGILATLATGLFDRLRLAQRLAINSEAQGLARSGAHGAEQLLLARLADPAAAQALVGQATALPVPDGNARLALADGGTCFNLNSLVVGPPGSHAARPIAVAQFARLLGLIGVDEEQARRLAAATADWIDSDDATLPGGAEDAAYARAAIPYRTAGALMAEASEWRAVAGVTPALYAKARPFLCALPEADMSRINVNRLAPAQAPLLAMITGQDVGSARQLIASRPPRGWASRDAFWASPALARVLPPADQLAQPQVQSQWISYDLAVDVAGSAIRETGLIRLGAPPRIAVRRWGPEE